LNRHVLRVALVMLTVVATSDAYLRTPALTDALRNRQQIQAARHPCACRYNSPGSGATCGGRSTYNEGMDDPLQGCRERQWIKSWNRSRFRFVCDSLCWREPDSNSRSRGRRPASTPCRFTFAPTIY